MIVAAALYDETAAYQLTHGLFDGLRAPHRTSGRTVAHKLLLNALHPDYRPCRWTEQQQLRIRGFINTVEALEP